MGQGIVFKNANPEVYKCYDAFHPDEIKEEFNEDLDKFKFYCWIPESLMGCGDTSILFNSLEELNEYWESNMMAYIYKYYKPTSKVQKYAF